MSKLFSTYSRLQEAAGYSDTAGNCNLITMPDWMGGYSAIAISLERYPETNIRSVQRVATVDLHMRYSTPMTLPIVFVVYMVRLLLCRACFFH